MKKTLIASAVAAAALTTNAFAMDPASDIAAKLDSMPTLYGNIQLAYVYSEIDVDGLPSTSTNETKDNGSTIGIKHSHAISEGLTGFLKMEYDVDADQKGANQFELDEGYIGVKGDFGSVQVGSDDSVYEWVDVLDMYEAVGLEGGLGEIDEGDNLQYVGNFGAVKVGVTYKIDSDTTDAAALAAEFAVSDDIAIVAAYSMGREEALQERGDSFGLAATMGIDDITLAVQYESKAEDSANNVDLDNDSSVIGFLAQYGMGATNFALGYEIVEFDNVTPGFDSEGGALYLQALHNVSDNMYVYLEAVQGDVELKNRISGATVDTDTTDFAVGATYAF